MKRKFDLAFAGGGISTTYTLMHLLESLEAAPKLAVPYKSLAPLSIVVVERSENLFTGVPYGSAVTETALIITPLRDFLPENEKFKFIAWLMANKDRLMNRHLVSIQVGDDLLKNVLKEWYLENSAAVSSNQWDDLCLPRRWFGEYIIERVKKAISRCTNFGLIEFETVRAEVVEVTRSSQYNFKLSLRENQGKISELISEHLILAIGSPPQNKIEPFFEAVDAVHRSDFLLIEDVYSPDFKSSLERILDQHSEGKAKERKNVLIVGSNASALEVTYHLRLNLDKINELFILSTDAKLPMLIGPVNKNITVPSVNVDLLKEAADKGLLTAEQLYTAIAEDTASAKVAGYNISDINAQVSRIMAGYLAQLSLEEQFVYFKRFGMKTTKMMRRAAKEYRLPLDDLMTKGKLKLIAGRYKSMFTDDTGNLTILYDDTNKKEVTLDASHVSVIINCTGSEQLNHTSSSVINSLVSAGLAKVTGNLLGLVVNEAFETFENLFVIGPLLAGNINKAINSWHVESAGRISLLAQSLAQCLKEKLFPNQLPVQNQGSALKQKSVRSRDIGLSLGTLRQPDAN